MSISSSRWAMKASACVLATLAPLAAGAAVTQASAYAALQAVQYRIYDATPDDGINPSVSWYDEIHYRLLLTSEAFDPITGDSIGLDQRVLFYPRFLEAFEASNSTSLVTSGGSATGKNDLPYVLQATSSVSAGGEFFEGYAGLSTTATSQLEPGFFGMILGPGTGIELRAFAQVSAAALNVATQCLTDCTFAYAAASLYASFGSPDPENSWSPLDPQTVNESIEASVFADSVCPSPNCFGDQKSGWISLTYENLSSGDEIGRMRWDVTANARAAAVVPEPGTFALTAAGIALLLRRARKPA